MSIKKNIKTCTYDNPTFMRRECWQDGRLLHSYSFDIFIQKNLSIPPELLFFGANVGPWKTGQLIGDPNAMKQDNDTMPIFEIHYTITQNFVQFVEADNIENAIEQVRSQEQPETEPEHTKKKIKAAFTVREPD